MLLTYLKISFRNILRNKKISFLNITGLSLGLVCTFLIFIYVKGELSYDRAFLKAQRIYRITDESLGEKGRHWAATPPALREVIQDFTPEVEGAGRFFNVQNQILQYNPDDEINKIFEETQGYYADENIPVIFDLDFIHGDQKTALEEINAIVLTESTAKKYFGDENPLGKILTDTYDGSILTVRGVIKELPPSHIKFDYLISMVTLYTNGRYPLESKTWNGFYTYILLRDIEGIQKVENKMDNLTAQFFASPDMSREEILEAGIFRLQPITEIHLHSNLEKEMNANGDITYIYIFSTAAIMILLLACINFINIQTVQSFRRIREVGVRKAMGTSKIQLVEQFLAESLVVIFIAAALVFIMINTALPVYNHLTENSLLITDIFTAWSLLAMAFLILSVGLITGFYPAIFLSGFKTVNALKGARNTGSSLSVFRKSLIVFQFIISIFMIISSLVIYHQLEFLQNKDLGFKKEQVIAIRLNGELEMKVQENSETFKSRLTNHAAITTASLVSRLPGERLGMGSLKLINNSEIISVRYMAADEDLLSVLEIDLLLGQNFIGSSSVASTAFILNESAYNLMSTEDIIGQEAFSMENSAVTGHITGVVKDFNFASLHSAVEPLVIEYQVDKVKYMLVKFKGQQVSEILELLKNEIQDYAPGSIFLYSFLNENIDLMYQSEQRVGRLFRVFTAFALLISCFGLLGLSAYEVELRTKEIAIRKILGATGQNILILLSSRFIKLVFIATSIAIPFAFYFTNSWLQEFAYRIEIQWWIILAGCGTAVFIALLAVSLNTIKAALADPVKNLRAD